MSRSEEIEALGKAMDRVLGLRFPAHDNYNTGRGEWTAARDRAVETILGQIKTEGAHAAEESAVLRRLIMALTDCISQAGHPDPAQGCRLVIATAKAALRLS